MGSSEELDYLFQIKLLLNTVDIKKYPFTKLIIENRLSEQEYNQVIQLIENLNTTYEKQKEEGLLVFEPLLLHFVGMLNEKLDPVKTLYALKKEGSYPPLMDTLLKFHSDNEM